MRFLLACLLCGGALCACRKKPAPAAAAPAVDTANAKEPTLNELNDAVQAWFTSRGQAPASLEELARARFISKVPTAPPGRQYVIDAQSLRVIVQ